MIKNMRRYENLHIFLWLIKDTCWVLDAKLAGLLVAVPTILIAFHITWLHRHDVAELLHNLAVCAWICANITWMVGEFFYNDSTRSYALIFFVIGLLFVSSYYFYYLPFVESKKIKDESETNGEKRVSSLVGKMMVRNRSSKK
ncbi:MAG: hypothetical protein LH473_00755 [Chitinophagales bacterium]|nr:hypothetical protein [Chitinophagales bacterium]